MVESIAKLRGIKRFFRNSCLFSKFIPNFSDLADTLNQLKRKNVPLCVECETRKRFSKFKRFLHDGTPLSLRVKAGQSDMIGPPNPVSNLRPILFRIGPNESQLEKEFRLRRGEVQEWNERFWHNHNSSFFKEREAYIASQYALDPTAKDKKTLSAEEMSVFYKRFLDKNWKVHFNYNVEWYRKNIGLARLAMKVKVQQWIRTVFSTPRT